MAAEGALATERLAGFVERGGRDRSAEMAWPGVAGAHAALETAYHAHNTASTELHRRVGIGGNEAQLLDRLVRVRIELADIARHAAPGLVVFCGIERGSYEREGVVAPYRARATRVFGFIDDIGWRQIHYHASIDDPLALADYQRAMRGPRS